MALRPSECAPAVDSSVLMSQSRKPRARVCAPVTIKSLASDENCKQHRKHTGGIAFAAPSREPQRAQTKEVLHQASSSAPHEPCSAVKNLSRH